MASRRPILAPGSERGTLKQKGRSGTTFGCELRPSFLLAFYERGVEVDGVGTANGTAVDALWVGVMPMRSPWITYSG